MDVAAVNVVNVDGSNQLEFNYNMTTPNSSCYLRINKCPERITGIKADVTVVSCAADQDCRARIAYHRGIHPPSQNYIWEGVQLRPNNNGVDLGNISFSAGLLDQNNGYDWIGDLYYNQFFTIATIGQTYTMSAIFDKPDSVTIAVDGQGSTTTKFPGKLDNHIDIFKAIGIRVSGTITDVTNGPFVVLFDNVQVKTKGACDKKKPLVKVITPKKNLPLDQCFVDITFNEPMADLSYDLETPVEWGAIDPLASYWSDNRKTFTAYRESCGVALPANTKLTFVVNPNGNAPMEYFRDLIGNPAKTKKITTKTAQ
ncbi:MAG: hypothetical protein GY702_04265 [Desulfobulbaceae bacterium]|nr:hypothetical protein [Desulfobulbaceae bacterium]